MGNFKTTADMIEAATDIMEAAADVMTCAIGQPRPRYNDWFTFLTLRRGRSWASLVALIDRGQIRACAVHPIKSARYGARKVY